MYQWRFIVHYPGIFICFIYPPLFYHLVVNFYPCENNYDYEYYVCGGACYQFEHVISIIDYLLNVASPTIIIVLANMILLYRVINQKRAMKLANTWQKNQLMYVQLVSISVLYLIIWIPFVIISLIRLFYDPFFLQDVILLIINYCLYIIPLVSPFSCLIGLPKVRYQLRRRHWHSLWAHSINHNRIGPARTMDVVRTRQQHILPSRQLENEHIC
ncbi:unnamed protein product [Adineta ricciae]|uniref:G-protein coupled receptors family 1 profile domain-containing protein n=1 Tax=Adineta ricciae TaxID=249248 RepID=A0A814HC73_ADIRI|nr:unnamed protein product [Adineta ricciae]